MITEVSCIDLRSDTVSLPTKMILESILDSELGDDCFGDDNSTLQLEEYCKDFFNAEAAMLTCGGTMSNQITLLSCLNPGDEIILDSSYHIHYFESAASSKFTNCCFNLTNKDNGIITMDDIDKLMSNKARWNDHYSRIKMISIENTVGTKGGIVYPIEVIKEIYNFTKNNDIFLYIDGARIFNACAASGYHPSDYMQYCDGMSFCFSKGLCAPLGSMILGRKRFIQQAKKYRKWIGGDMHQYGIIAKSAHTALIQQWDKMDQDHHKMKTLYTLIKDSIPDTVELSYPGTNMLFINTQTLSVDAHRFEQSARIHNIKVLAWDKHTIRAVCHRQISNRDIEISASVIINIIKEYSRVENVQ